MLAALGALAVLLALLFPGSPLHVAASPWLPLHLALGIASYGLFGAAVVAAGYRLADSDGYGTGFVTYVLLQSGAKPTDVAVTKGVKWLKTNQRESGRWYTRSLNNDADHYIANAGTAFAVLALDAVGH